MIEVLEYKLSTEQAKQVILHYMDMLELNKNDVKYIKALINQFNTSQLQAYIDSLENVLLLECAVMEVLEE